MAVILEVGQSFAYQNYSGLLGRCKGDAIQYTWNGNSLEEFRVSAEDWKAQKQAA